ncbi:MAG: hypothetical protein D6694_03060 [Gammaproteobacteria bacterium]|nr:MAG: hypothetical protein D6694_03060 [Gammaproteobacteria bacterium]
MSAVVGILKKILVPLAAVIVTVALGIGLLLSGLLPFSIQLSTGEEVVADSGPPAASQQQPAQDVQAPGYFQVPESFTFIRGIFYDTGQRIVNLADPGGYRYLRIQVVLEFLPDNAEYYSLEGEKLTAEQDRIRAEIDRQRPLIDDVITNVLTSKTFDEIFTVEGKAQLRQELKEELNRALRNRHVENVLITDFVIQ